MFEVTEQYLDTASGFHVIKLRHGKTEHIVQIAVGHDTCPACGAVHPKTNIGELDPKAAVAQVIAELDYSQQNALAYAKKHGLQIR